MTTSVCSIGRAALAACGLFALSSTAISAPLSPITQAPAMDGQLPVVDVQCGPMGCGGPGPGRGPGPGFGPGPGGRPPGFNGPGYGPPPPPRYYGNDYYRGYYRRNYWPRYYGPGLFFNFYGPSYDYVAPRRYYREGRYSQAHIDWCYDRYRSYRASDNTYQPYHGGRRECYSPYW